VAVLEVEGLEVRFPGRPVLCGVDLAIDAGEVVALSGANGAGKSTLLRACAGLVVARAGQVRVAGVTPAAARAKGWLGWSGDGAGGFDRRLSLAAHLRLWSRLAGLDGRQAAARALELAQLLEFEAHLTVPAQRCSSGVRQRACLARALLGRPRLLLLDEPFRSIDAASGTRLARRMLELAGDAAVLWISHDPAEAARVASRAFRLDQGRVLSMPLAVPDPAAAAPRRRCAAPRTPLGLVAPPEAAR
jgi:ABC-type multidrug transport system ATPase subunit